MPLVCTDIQGYLFLFVPEKSRGGKRGTETVMLFLGLQVQNMKCALFSSYESRFDSSICSAKACRKTKLWAIVVLFLAHSPEILVTFLDIASCDISVSKGLSVIFAGSVPHQLLSLHLLLGKLDDENLCKTDPIRVRW